MITISKRGEIDIRAGAARPARLSLCSNHDYLTFSGECDCVGDARKTERFAVIGTDYGWLHNTAGDIRMWRSESGARRAAKRYICA